MPNFNITRCAHAELKVTDFDKARRFYVDALGMLEIASDKERIYLGGLEERDKYCLVLRKADAPGLGHLAFRVSSETDLEQLAELHQRHKLSVRWIEPNQFEAGQGRALRVQDPNGLPIEFVFEMEQRERMLQRFDLYRGANVMRIDHFNCQVPDVAAGFKWWNEELGFYLSEYTVSDDPSEQYWAMWLHRKQNVHDIALMNGRGPRLHHVGLYLENVMSVLRACDVLASMGMVDCIERGPGRHGLSNAFFLYLRDPDGNRIELFTSDYIIPDPDFKPIKWKLSDPRRATFWGAFAPRSWFEEASLVEDVLTGKAMPTTEAKLSGRPTHLT